ncbi:MAG TPA: TonB family protein [Pyrinomonadaceae bacterium]
MFRAIVSGCLVKLALVGLCVAGAQPFQETKRPYGVPEATLSSTPEEQVWWNELRRAGDDLLKARRSVDKPRKKFLTVLQDGETKSYKPPVPDARPVVLYKAFPQYTEEGRRRSINGDVTVQVELLADGTIGSVRVVKGLGAGLDENAADAARQTVFLPAVKNREFVTSSIQMHMSFHIY